MMGCYNVMSLQTVCCIVHKVEGGRCHQGKLYMRGGGGGGGGGEVSPG